MIVQFAAVVSLSSEARRRSRLVQSDAMGEQVLDRPSVSSKLWFKCCTCARALRAHVYWNVVSRNIVVAADKMAWRDRLQAVIDAVDAQLGVISRIVADATTVIKADIEAEDLLKRPLEEDLRTYREALQGLVFTFKALTESLVDSHVDEHAAGELKRLYVSLQSSLRSASKESSAGKSQSVALRSDESNCCDPSCFGSALSASGDESGSGRRSFDEPRGVRRSFEEHRAARRSFEDPHAARRSLDQQLSMPSVCAILEEA